jgi:DNA-directed RNA polymerase subunit RPC12/RpoP
MEYKCPCGKTHKSRNTVSRHKKALAQKAIVGGIPKDIPNEKKGQDTQGRSFLKEINLSGEFNKMAETINPKKDETKEAKYECGSCHNKFNDKYKRCPHCGVEFE